MTRVLEWREGLLVVALAVVVMAKVLEEAVVVGKEKYFGRSAFW